MAATDGPTARDLADAAELVRAGRATRRGGEHPFLWLLGRALDGELNGSAVRFWRSEDGALSAAALWLPGGSLAFTLHPGDGARVLARKVVGWALGLGPEVRTEASSWDSERRALLAELGFAEEPGALRMARELDPGAPATAPPGIRLRPTTGEDELDAYVALFAAAMGSGPTAEARRRLQRSRGYRSDLDLVALAPDGRLVGFCLAFVYDEDNAALGRRDAWVEQMGTHPDWRRRGIGRALSRAALDGLRRHGADTAYLETGQTNAAAQALYASERFRRDATVVRYTKRR